MKRFRLAILILIGSVSPLRAELYEPKEVKSEKAIKSDQGVVRLSLRSQRQFIETAYIYFVEMLPDGSDGQRMLQFERGAGVPLMGTNMIDVKVKYYRVPKGRYRLLAYTVACAGLPPPGTTCSFYGNSMPTARYATGSPTFEVASNTVTDWGDFIIEYAKVVDLDNFDLFSDRFSDDGYEIRWRAIKTAIQPTFASLPAGPAPVVPVNFLSRIECEQRPKSKTVQFPFRCPVVTEK